MSTSLREERFVTADARFEFGKRIGQSWQTVTWLAHDRKLRRDVVLETLREGQPGVERFLHGAATCAALAHPGIVPIHDFGVFANGQPYVVMPLVEGMTLSEALEEHHRYPHRLDLVASHATSRKLLERFVDVCRALDYAHSRGVVHRDLEPANVILRPEGAVIVGWGLAHEIDGFPDGSRPSGTSNYLSPEQARGENVSARTDVYLLGATLYEILTGQPPRVGEGPEVLEAARRGEFVPLGEVAPKVPGDLAAVCTKALAADPTLRYQTAKELAEEVARFLADEPVKARPEPMATGWRRRAKRHRALLTAGLVVLAALALGLPLLIGTAKELTDAEDRIGNLMQNQELARQELLQARADLAVMNNAAGKQLLEAGKPEEALARFEEARALGEEVAREVWRDQRSQSALAASQNNVADAQRQLGKANDARQNYHAAKDLLVTLIEEGAVPQLEVVLQAELARSYAGLAELEADEAARVGWRLKQAAALLGADEYLGASDVAEAASKGRLTAAQQYELACVFSRCAARARKDSARPLPLQEKRAEAWSQQAMGLLRVAQSRGHFKDRERFDQVKVDPALEALRQRDDFQRWLGGL